MNKKESVCEERIYDEVYKTYAPSLLNFMFFKCTDRDKSHDLVQEAFIKLWENCSKVSPEKAKSYLFTVANNLFLNTVAHQKVRFRYAEITETQRTAFLMSRIEGKKYREIAEILNISEKAAGKRISDALEALRITIENI